MLDKETLKRLNEIESAAYRCVIDEHYFEIVTGNTKRDFWTVVQNALGDGVCLYWFHLFGNHKDDLHYSKFFSRPDVLAVGKEYSKEAVKKRILAVIGYDDEEYKKFREEVKCCRDKFVAHREIGAKGIYPNINICRLMAEELRVVLSELVEKCKAKAPDDDELFWWHHYYSSHNNKWLYNKCLMLYNTRVEDSSDLK
jgi:hypothetical protein